MRVDCVSESYFIPESQQPKATKRSPQRRPDNTTCIDWTAGQRATGARQHPSHTVQDNMLAAGCRERHRLRFRPSSAALVPIFIGVCSYCADDGTRGPTATSTVQHRNIPLDNQITSLRVLNCNQSSCPQITPPGLAMMHSHGKPRNFWRGWDLASDLGEISR